ncbi:MAG: amidohydrolase family protein [Anaerolineae bacterium]|jgi:5-methylthioadenosine/S-adenosylhomocysteine deaminase|nr:amidohydrolase family protein [Anaerolineae bacterium]
MQRVDTIFSGGFVLTMDDRFTTYADGAVAVKDGKVVAVGPTADITAQYSADETVDCTGQYIMPGLINTHTHVPMTLLRAMSDDQRLDVWLNGYIMPTEREFVSPEFCRVGTKLACAEMIRGGVTTFTDMYYFEDDIAAATAEVGMRAVLGETVLKFPAPDADSYEESLALTRTMIEKWRGHPLITPAVAPHAPYSNTEETLRKCTELALEFDVPLIIHIAETRAEAEDHLSANKQTIVHWLNKIGLFRAKVIAAHCVWIDETEMRIFREKGGSIAHCPSANLKLASGIASVSQMLESGVTVGIGTDGPASNNDLDMFEEMRLAALLAKAQTYNPTALPARTALLMATRQGAQVLGLEKVTGSLETGKAADIIVVDAQPLHNIPHYDFNPDNVYGRIVYSAKSSDVAHTMVAGQFLLRDRQLLTVDEAVLRDQANGYAERIGAFLSDYKSNVLSKLIAVSVGVERGESFEVQSKAVLRDPSAIEILLDHPDVEVLRTTHYRQHDTYFVFDDPSAGRVRYREDDKLDEQGRITEVRTRLTYTSPIKEKSFDSMVDLSHSRFIAAADRPLRFYREYFQANKELTLDKDRRRWAIHYRGVQFYINVDQLLQPNQDQLFVEIKSRTWSARDADFKAAHIQEMLKIMGIEPADVVSSDYLEMAHAE